MYPLLVHIVILHAFQEWDNIRNQRTDALDAVLESLGTQSVPPDFHTVSADSSPFGSQNNSDDEQEGERLPQDDTTPFGPPQPNTSPRMSPTDTIRNRSPVLRRQLRRERRKADRSRWKTLRDFVNERAIEDLLDTIEKDRQELDVRLSRFRVVLCPIDPCEPGNPCDDFGLSRVPLQDNRRYQGHGPCGSSAAFVQRCLLY